MRSVCETVVRRWVAHGGPDVVALLSIQFGGMAVAFVSPSSCQVEKECTIMGFPSQLFDILLCSYKTDIAVILCVTLLDMFSIATENNWRGEQIGDVTELLATCYLANC